MNDHADPRARLVADSFHDNWADGPARGFARRAAAHARTRRAVRRAVAGGGALVAIVTVFFFAARRPATTSAGGELSAATAPAARAYEIISDQEFEELLRDRPLLILPQQNGGRTIVLLAR